MDYITVLTENSQEGQIYAAPLAVPLAAVFFLPRPSGHIVTEQFSFFMFIILAGK